MKLKMLMHPVMLEPEMDCSRDSYLDEKAQMMVAEKEMQICMRRRKEAGFATLMDMKAKREDKV